MTMQLAIGRLLDPATDQYLGMVFGVTERFGLTAMHCVGDRILKFLRYQNVRCDWTTASSEAVVADFDPYNDVALLRFAKTLPRELDIVALESDPIDNIPFTAIGSPTALPGLASLSISGTITASASRLADGAQVIQLGCQESASLSLHGFSGTPVLVGQPKKAGGVIRWNAPQVDHPELAVGGMVFAARPAEIIRRWPELDPSRKARHSDIVRLLGQLSSRKLPQATDVMQEVVCELLLTGPFGLKPNDMTGRFGPFATGPRSIYIRPARVTIEVAEDLRMEDSSNAGRGRLLARLLANKGDSTKRFLGILTDGAEWRVYRLSGNQCYDVEKTFLLNQAAVDAEGFLSWLEATLGTAKDIRPSPAEIREKLGSASLAYALDSIELQELYDKYRNNPDVRVRRAMWAKLLTTASGISFQNEDKLFIDHTLLVAMAEVIGHAVLDLRLDSSFITAADIMAGKHFADAQIGGVIEPDFFDWVARVPGGNEFVQELIRRLTRFEWGEVQHDVLKILYESIISEETRRQLGEYYTPDWLAEKIVLECYETPTEQCLLDASCGSGTFLFHAVRRYIESAEGMGMSDQEIMRNIGSHVIGFDVQPVAVTLARVTYLLALGMQRIRASQRPPFTVPVYLGDSLRWGQEAGLSFDSAFNVPTTLDHETFLSDAGLAKAPGLNLRFPNSILSNAGFFDSLVRELADRATERESGTDPPSLSGVFRRFKIESVDDQSMLRQTFHNMCALHDAEMDHIWGYYVRNLARPAWLSLTDNRIDVLVGNPPWLPYRSMTNIQRSTFREMSRRRGLWTGAIAAPNYDLSALFIVRCIEQYLRPGGKFGYVMPLAALTRTQYAGFRSGNYSTSVEEVKIAFSQPWDLHNVKPKFFRQSVGAVFGIRQKTSDRAVSLIENPEMWSGRFNTRFASWIEAAPSISRAIEDPLPPLGIGSLYSREFSEGATVVPRFLFFVERRDQSSLGVSAGRTAVESSRSRREKLPWRDLRSQIGTVEEQFIFPLITGECLMPFNCLTPHEAVIPWDGSRLLEPGSDELDLYPGLAEWWRNAAETWMRYRSGNRLTLPARLDFRRGISKQFPARAYRVVFSASGMYLASALITAKKTIIEHKLYWGSVSGLDEGRFLTAIFNSEVLTASVSRFQGRGESNPRDFDKYLFKLPIPLFDTKNLDHQRLVRLAERAELISSQLELPQMRFEKQRGFVRRALAMDGVSSEIDTVVHRLLTQRLDR